MPATQRKCIYGGSTLDVDRHYIGSATATTHQEKGIITLESNPSRGTVLPASHGKGNNCDKNVKYKRTDALSLWQQQTNHQDLFRYFSIAVSKICITWNISSNVLRQGSRWKKKTYVTSYWIENISAIMMSNNTTYESSRGQLVLYFAFLQSSTYSSWNALLQMIRNMWETWSKHSKSYKVQNLSQSIWYRNLDARKLSTKWWTINGWHDSK